MTPFDFQESERLLKESQNTPATMPTLLPDWETIHRWKKKVTGQP
jgi:hypothetical protein